MAHHEESAVVQQFLDAFGFQNVVGADQVRGLFNQRQFTDADSSRAFVIEFAEQLEGRDPNGIKPVRKRMDAVMNESPQMTLMMEFLVRCRQAHLFQTPGDKGSNESTTTMGSNQTTPTPSITSSPFQRRSASRGRVLSTLTGEHLNESTTSSRSRANSSFTSYDNRMESRQLGVVGGSTQRTRSPAYRTSSGIGTGGITGIPTTSVSQLTASNHLFSAPNAYPGSQHFRGSTPTSHHVSARLREDSPSNYRNPPAPPTSQQQPFPLRQTTPTFFVVERPVISDFKSFSPIILIFELSAETETAVCECLLNALLGIETRLFTPIHRKMTITSTASISTTHIAVCQRVLSIANTFLIISHKELPTTINQSGHVTMALLASIRQILGDYIADIDELRRMKELKFHHCLPLIDKWQIRLNMVAMAWKIRYMPQLELLEFLFILHSAYSFDEDRLVVLNKILDYTMGVFCKQMMEWMTTGEVPADKWMIEKDESGDIVLKKIPIFISETDARILLQIGKSLPHVESASDEDLESIDNATTVVRAALSPELIFKKELTPILKILRDVVCGIVMRMVLTSGRLKEHIHKATSFFFLSDPRFTATLYSIIKKASMGLRVGSAALSRQTVSSALAAALEATVTYSNREENREKKLKFKLDAMASLGSTPNVSSKMQFVQPLSPRYEPQMDLMKPIFSACDSEYESIFHVIWAIDLSRYSTQEVVQMTLPSIQRFLINHSSISFRENATCLLNTLSHVFYVINSTLLRLRSLISLQLNQNLSRFLAAIDEKCVDVDDVIREHLKFVRRVSVVVFIRNNEKIEHELANLLRISFEAQEFAEEFGATWHDVIDATGENANVRKARIAEICQKRTLGVRMLMDEVNKRHETITQLIDEQNTYGSVYSKICCGKEKKMIAWWKEFTKDFERVFDNSMFYLEPQQKNLCVLHSVNNALQRKDVTLEEMVAIAESMAADKHGNQTGEFSVQTAIKAFAKRGLVMEWTQSRFFRDKNLDPEKLAYIIALLGESRDHCMAMRQINCEWYIIDSSRPPRAYKIKKEVLLDILAQKYKDNLVTYAIEGTLPPLLPHFQKRISFVQGIRVPEFVVLTSIKQHADHNIVKISREKTARSDKVLLIGGGQHAGLIINRFDEKAEFEPAAHISLSFSVHLTNNKEQKQVQEKRSLYFSLVNKDELDVGRSVVHKFFRNLLSNLPADYVSFMKRAMTLLQKEYQEIAQVVIDYKIVDEDKQIAIPDATQYEIDKGILELKLPEKSFWSEVVKTAKKKVLKFANFNNSTTISADQQPTVAILSCLFVEKQAVDALIEESSTIHKYTSGGESNVYTLGRIGSHRVVATKLALIGDSREAITSAGSITTRLLGNFQNIEHVFIVGVGGAVPHFTDASLHARLGDVIVSASRPKQNIDHQYTYGHDLVYDYFTNKRKGFNVRDLEAEDKTIERIVESGGQELVNSWNSATEEAISRLTSSAGDVEWKAPPESTDVLAMAVSKGNVVVMPHPNENREGGPEIHLGTVGAMSAMKKYEKTIGGEEETLGQIRESFAESFGIRCMDAGFDSVVGAVKDRGIRSWALIRGISDYQDGLSRAGQIWRKWKRVAVKRGTGRQEFADKRAMRNRGTESELVGVNGWKDNEQKAIGYFSEHSFSRLKKNEDKRDEQESSGRSRRTDEREERFEEIWQKAKDSKAHAAARAAGMVRCIIERLPETN